MLPYYLLLVFLSCHYLCCTGQDTDDIPEYDPACPTIKPVQNLDEQYAGTWYVVVTSVPAPFTCTVTRNKELCRHSYQGNAVSKDPSGKYFKQMFKFDIKSAACPAGLVSDLSRGFFTERRMMYILDDTGNGTCIIYGCMKKDNKISELLQVFSKTKTYNMTYIKEVLKRNSLQRLKLQDTVSMCTSEDYGE